MTTRTRSFLPALALSAALTVGAMAAYAQTSPAPGTQDDHDAHHPAESGQSTPPAPAPGQAPSSGGRTMGMMGQQGGQPGGGMMMGGGDMARMMSMMHGGGMMGGMPFQHVEGRLAFLKAELKITSAQEPQWSKFADAFRSVAKSAQGMRQQMMGGDQTTGGQAVAAPQRLDRYEKMLTARLDAVRTIKAAFDPLYTSLSDEQKKTADDLFGSPMGVL